MRFDGLAGLPGSTVLIGLKGFFGSTELMEFSGLLNVGCHVAKTEAAMDGGASGRLHHRVQVDSLL
jgi:hypothetical protein